MAGEGARHGASFRDPDGFVFEREGVLYRQVNPGYAEDLRLLRSSGLMESLVDDGMLLAHEEVDEDPAEGEAHAVLRPERVPFVSYPYEWCFSQLKDAALLTLDLQERAMDRGMSLKDATPFNVQFLGCRPVFIDLLSFEALPEGRPWVAYRQFCQGFLAPLALMSYVDVRLGGLLRTHLEGLPLDMASGMLPLRTRLRPSMAIHLHAHAWAQGRYQGEELPDARRTQSMGEASLRGMLDSLRSLVESLDWDPTGTGWHGYYQETNYPEEALAAKEQHVAAFLERVAPGTVWDLGANTGRFSRLAAERGARTLAFDIDPGCVEACYREARERRDERLLPLLQDLMNPSPPVGFAGRERHGLLERGPADCVLALALIHHLAIAANVPLGKIARLLTSLGEHLVVEFVPKQDSQVARLLSTREDIFPDYTREGFEAAFAEVFEPLEVAELPGSSRSLHLMRARAEAPPAG